MKRSLLFTLFFNLLVIGSIFSQADVLANAWEDLNGNGIRDGGEPGLNGIPISLFDSGNAQVGATQNTTGAGEVTFLNVPDGTGYYIVFGDGGYKVTTADVGGGNTQGTDVDTDSDAIPPALESHTFDIAGINIDGIGIGLFTAVEINGNVWLDLNANGQDEGDGPIPQAVDVTLLDDMGNLVTTDADGNPLTNPINPTDAYSFTNLFPGTYTIQFEEPGGSHPTGLHLTLQDVGSDATDSDADRITGETVSVTLDSGDPPVNDIDAGYFVVAQVGDFVWEDLNGNGIQDGEPGLAGVQVTLEFAAGGAALDPDGNPIAPQTSGGAGDYLFDEVPPGDYIVIFETPFAPYFLTEPDQTGDATDSDADLNTGQTPSFTLQSGDSNTDLDAGYYQKCTIGDFTWEDLNGNGLQDGGEPGLDGVSITITDDVTAAPPLFEVDGTTAYNPNTTSGGGGAYIFDNLPPGMYYITFSAPGGYFFTQAGGDSDADQTTGITVAVTCESGDNQDLDAGFLQPGEIAGFAFHDRDANGLFDGSDVLLNDITFTLTNLNGPTNDITGAAVGPITTAGGTYRFTNLPPGDYTVDAGAAGWIFTTPNVSGDAGDNPDASDDSDFDGGGRLVNDISLEGGEAVEDRAAGLYMLITLGGTVWGEDDESCSIGSDESGQNMVNVNLLDANGVVVATATTNAMGDYQFTGLAPGTYTVELAGSNFASGGNLYGLQSCGCTGGDDDVDGDDNGDGPTEGPVSSVPIELLCGLEPGNMGLENLTIDFCFYADCRNPNPLTAPSCGTVTDTICDLAVLNIICSRMPTPPLVDPAPAPLCNGAGFPHNMSWFAFVAGSGNYSIDINVFGCVGGDGSAQMGIKQIEDCDFGSAIDIFCQAAGITGIVSIPSGDLIPGNTYFLWLDGSTGAVCSYDISINGDFQQYQVPDPVDVLCINNNANSNGQCDTICPGTMMEFEARDAYDMLNAKFTWTITKPDGSTEVVVTSGPDARYLEYTFPDLGNYEVELTDIYVKCSVLPITKIIIPVVVANPPDEDFGIYELCEDLLDTDVDGPWPGPTVVWETSITDPNLDGWDGWFGTETYDKTDDGMSFTYNVNTPDGCFHQQTVAIEMLLNSPPFFIDTIMCDGEILEIGPYVVDRFPVAALDLPFPNAAGCDSNVVVTASAIGLVGRIDGGCSNGGYQLTYIQIENPLINAFLTYDYIWTNITEGTIVDDDDPDNDPTTVIVTESGEYEVMVIVTLEDGSKSCQIPIPTLTIDIDDLAPEMVTEDGNWGTEFCDGASAAFTYEINFTEDPQNIINYVWTYPNGVTVIGPDDSTSINLNWAGTNGGPICMSIQTLCGTSPPLCDTVVITPIPSATLPVLPIICVDSLTTISSQGTSLPTYVYNWDFDGGSPVGTGAGPYNVSWGSEGIKEIELVIDNLSCLSQPVTTNIQVVAPEAPPLISCTTPGIGAVNFFWDDVDNNLGYNIQVISGQAGGGNQTDTLINFSGLGEGDTVEILLTTLTNSPCGNLTSTLFCVSQNCVPPQVDIDQVNPICITSGSQPIQLNAQINPPSNGTYIYSGNPAVSSTGLFDPLLAAEGVNTVRLEYIDPDNCRQFTTTQITVNITPTADFTSNDNLICQDSTVEIQYSGNITNGGNFDWEFGAGVITPGNGSGPFDIQWNSPGQKTVELTVTKNGCISETETFNVTVEPRVPQVDIRCDDEQATSITVAWDEVVNTTDYTLIVDGVPFNTNDLTYTITGLTPGSDHTFELIANSDNSCPGTTMSITCNANACPPITIDFSIGDTTICLNSNAAPFQIQALISGGLGTGNGTVTWSGSGIDPVTGIFDPNLAGVSTNPLGHVITALFEEETCDQSENIRIRVINQPVSTFTGIDAICITDEYNVIYTGTGGLPLDWQEPNGVTVTPNGVGRYKVTFPNPGNYTFGLVTGVAGCLSELTQKTVEVQEELDEITIDCSTTLTSVEFTWNDIDCVTDYEITIDGVDEGIQSDLSYLLTGLPEGQTVDIIVTPISDCECPAISVAANCTARACPPVVLALTSAQNNFCDGDVTTPFQLNAGVTGSDGSGTGVWSGTGVNAQGQFNPAGLAPGSYTLNYEFGEANCSFDDDIIITILSNPTVSVAATNPDCFLENVGSVIPTTSGGNGNYTYRLDGNAVTLNDLNTINPGSHILVVNDGNNCDASASFSIIAAQPATISISGQSLIILGESVQLNTTIGNIAANLIDSIVWTNSAGQVLCSGANCNALTITPEFDDTYCATLYYNDGCNVEDCFDVELKKIIEIILPNIIRPGNPTNNSFFIEQYANIKKVNSMSIFDRWGNLVFTQKDFLPGSSVAWDGKLDNRDIVPGVYAYTIDLILTDDEPLLINGDVTVIR